MRSGEPTPRARLSWRRFASSGRSGSSGLFRACACGRLPGNMSDQEGATLSSEQLAADVAAYLERGGTITVVPEGVSGWAALVDGWVPTRWPRRGGVGGLSESEKTAMLAAFRAWAKRRQPMKWTTDALARMWDGWYRRHNV